MTEVPVCVSQLAEGLARLGWVCDLWVAGSLATGDHLPGVSDLDLVAVVDGLDAGRVATLTVLHEQLDRHEAAGWDLGCAYVEASRLEERQALHPTWTHGSLVRRPLSSVVRAELTLHGFAVLGRDPSHRLPSMDQDDVRAAACAELSGYWTWAVCRPWVWLDPVIADLGLTSMARGRSAMASGRLLTKSRAVEQIRAPAWLAAQLRARRRGVAVTSPRGRTAVIAWFDACVTVIEARRAKSRLVHQARSPGHRRC